MKRREFITLLGGGAAAWQLVAAGSSPSALLALDILCLRQPPNMHLTATRFARAFAASGTSKAATSASSDNDRLPALAAELVRLNVDVIITYATGVIAAQRPTCSN